MLMAAHMQQQVLDAVVASLKAARTRAGDSVFLDRLDNVEYSKLPVILVDESPEGETIEPGTITDVQQRTLAVTVRCVLSPSNAAAAGAETRAFGLEVEKAMRAPATLTAIRALCKAYAISASRLEKSIEADRPYAQRAQDWSFTYFTRRGTPDATL
jgi:fumarate hydratase class II